MHNFAAFDAQKFPLSYPLYCVTLPFPKNSFILPPPPFYELMRLSAPACFIGPPSPPLYPAHITHLNLPSPPETILTLFIPLPLNFVKVYKMEEGI